MNGLNLLKEDLDKCVRCGTCRSVCPVFWILGRETASARGKLALIHSYLKGEIGLSETYIKHMKECTLCGACKANCPNGVDTTGIISAARADSVEKLGVPLAASLVFKNLLNSGGLMAGAIKIATRLQSLFFKDANFESGLLSRFSLPLIGNNRLLPPLARTFFLELPEVRELSGLKASPCAKTTKIAFYAGCGINYLMPEVGKASIEALKRAGVEVIVPSGQVCCGMPAYSMGDVNIAREMALKNLEAFEEGSYDFIATSCATCGWGLKNLFRKLLGDCPETRGRVEAFASKVRDISELLINELHFRGGGKRGAQKRVVTYHDPCHLGRNQGIRDEPRKVIEMGDGVVLKEMRHPCSCCGLGGGLSISNYELSMDVARRKAESVRDSGAEIVATACPGCMVQLRDGLHRYGVKAKVMHVVELL